MAVAHSLAVVIYHLPQNPTQHYQDLGANWFGTLDPQQLTRHLVRRLEQLGFQVQLTPNNNAASHRHNPTPQISPDRGRSLARNADQPRPQTIFGPRPEFLHLSKDANVLTKLVKLREKGLRFPRLCLPKRGKEGLIARADWPDGHTGYDTRVMSRIPESRRKTALNTKSASHLRRRNHLGHAVSFVHRT